MKHSQESLLEEMTLAGKQQLYEQMVRECDLCTREEIEAPGPESANPFIQRRQEIFRSIMKDQGGFVYAKQEGEFHHLPA